MDPSDWEALLNEFLTKSGKKPEDFRHETKNLSPPVARLIRSDRPSWVMRSPRDAEGEGAFSSPAKLHRHLARDRLDAARTELIIHGFESAPHFSPVGRAIHDLLSEVIMAPGDELFRETLEYNVAEETAADIPLEDAAISMSVFYAEVAGSLAYVALRSAHYQQSTWTYTEVEEGRVTITETEKAFSLDIRRSKRIFRSTPPYDEAQDLLATDRPLYFLQNVHIPLTEEISRLERGEQR